jgi:transcriptional regulator with XRE-family HTH domain
MPLLWGIGLPFVNIGKVISMVSKRSTRERSPFGLRMFQARERAGLTQVDVCQRLEISQGTLSGLELSAASSGKVVEFAKLYDVDAEWLSTGRGIAPPGLSGELDSSGPIAREPERTYGVAHPPIYGPATFPPERARQHVEWGELGMRELEGTFSVAAPDESMAPVIKRGQTLQFDRNLVGDVRADDVVLLKDGAGVWYVRTYQQGPRGRWAARAENGSFLAMDSERDELELIAVLTAVIGRRG